MKTEYSGKNTIGKAFQKSIREYKEASAMGLFDFAEDSLDEHDKEVESLAKYTVVLSIEHAEKASGRPTVNAEDNDDIEFDSDMVDTSSLSLHLQAVNVEAVFDISVTDTVASRFEKTYPDRAVVGVGIMAIFDGWIEDLTLERNKNVSEDKIRSAITPDK